MPRSTEARTKWALQVIIHFREGVFCLLEEVIDYLFAEIPHTGIIVHVQNLFKGGMVDDVAVVVEVDTSLHQGVSCRSRVVD